MAQDTRTSPMTGSATGTSGLAGTPASSAGARITGTSHLHDHSGPGPEVMAASDFEGDRKRPAATIAAQWAPNETSEYTFEAFYQGYREEMFNNRFIRRLVGQLKDEGGNFSAALLRPHRPQSIEKVKTAVGDKIFDSAIVPRLARTMLEEAVDPTTGFNNFARQLFHPHSISDRNLE